MFDWRPLVAALFTNLIVDLPQQMPRGGGIIDVRVARPVTGDRLGQVDTAGLRDAGMPNVPAHTPVVPRLEAWGEQHSACKSFTVAPTTRRS